MACQCGYYTIPRFKTKSQHELRVYWEMFVLCSAYPNHKHLHFRWPSNLERIKLKNLFLQNQGWSPRRPHRIILLSWIERWGSWCLDDEVEKQTPSHSSESKDERLKIKHFLHVNWLAPQDNFSLPAGQHTALLLNSIREIKTIFVVVKAQKGQERGGGHNFPSIFSKTGVPDVFPSKGTLETKLEPCVICHLSECLTYLRDSNLRVGL